MIGALNQKVVVVKQPTAIQDNTALTITALDTVPNGNKFDYVTFEVLLGATDIALTVLKLTESDDDSSYSDVDGSAYGGTGNPTLPSATDDNKIYAIHVDARYRKRYLKLAVTIGDGTAGGFIVVLARMSRPHESPNTAAKRGYAAEITV